MSIINNLKFIPLHHAYLIENDNQDILIELEKFFIKDLKFEIKANPDFWYGKFDTFGIDDGRVIKEKQSQKAFSGDKKIFVIIANFFTHQAQNSLLKMFEEPTEGTHFFIITQNIETLLPTLRSRMFVIQRNYSIKNKSEFLDTSIKPKEFLESSKVVRIKLLDFIIQEKDKNSAILFLNELEKILGENISNKNIRKIREILKCKKYLNGPSPSVKMILEHISLIV